MKIITAKGFWAQIPRLEIAQNVIRKNRLKIKSLGPRSTCQKCLQDKNPGPKIQANAWWQRLMFPNGWWCQLVPSDACPFFRLSQIAPVVLLWFLCWLCFYAGARVNMVKDHQKKSKGEIRFYQTSRTCISSRTMENPNRVNNKINKFESHFTCLGFPW